MTGLTYEVRSRRDWTETARAIALLPLALVLLVFLAVRERW
jgi:hypothetical protein